MNHNAVFEFKVLSLENFEAAFAAVVKTAETSVRSDWHLVRLRCLMAVFSGVIRLVMRADGGIQMLMRCVLVSGS